MPHMKHEFIKNIKNHKFWILLILIIIIISSYFTIQEMIVIRRIANEFQMEFRISPSREELFTHLFHEELKPSMTRQEVHAVLDRIDNWEIRWYDEPDVDQGVWDTETQQYVFKEKIRFPNHQIVNVLKSWLFCYNKDGVLVHFEVLDIGGKTSYFVRSIFSHQWCGRILHTLQTQYN